MELFQVAVESHRRATTIYVAGLLAQGAADRVDEATSRIPDGVAMLRVDLRGVELIDPTAFATVVRALARWRDTRRGRIALHFPARSFERLGGLRVQRPGKISPWASQSGAMLSG